MKGKLNYSVIMAVKNGMNYMIESIESIYSQTLRPSEIILIDDHSTDLTRETIFRDYPDILLIDSVRHGQSEAMNLGIKRACSEVVAFLDHDDLWASNKQEIQLEILGANRELDAVTSGVVNFSEQGESRDLGPARVFGATSFRRNVFSKFGYLDPSISHHGVIEWWVRAESKGINHSTHPGTGLLRRVHTHNSGIVNRLESRNDLFSILREQTSISDQNEV